MSTPERRPDGYLTSLLGANDSLNMAMSLDIPEVVSTLVDLLGATDVATLAGVRETRAVQQWMNGERQPQRPNTLRFALQLSLMISTLATRELARAWFHGSNPNLGDKTPLAVLRDESLEAAQVPLMTAVRSFVQACSVRTT